MPGTASDFIENNMALAQSIAWKYVPYVQQSENIKFDKDDLLSIAYLGLVKAYQKFDPTRFVGLDGGVKFSTYAVPVIKGEIRRWIRDHGCTIRKSRNGEIIPCDSLDMPIGGEDDRTLGDVVQTGKYEMGEQIVINDFLGSIKPRLRKVYDLRNLGLNQTEVGEVLGISQVQSSRLEKTII